MLARCARSATAQSCALSLTSLARTKAEIQSLSQWQLMKFTEPRVVDTVCVLPPQRPDAPPALTGQDPPPPSLLRLSTSAARAYKRVTASLLWFSSCLTFLMSPHAANLVTANVFRQL